MKLSKEKLIELYEKISRARAYDDLFKKRLLSGKLLGFFHSAKGGEAPGVGGCAVLNDEDFIIPHLRGHGIPHMVGKGVEIKYYLAEHTGKSTGMCRGVSCHHRVDLERGLYGHSAVLGSCFPLAVGFGLAAQKNKKKQVVVAFFGDGGMNRGTLHEAFLMAANWKLPIVWVCENNEMAQFVSVRDHYPLENIASLADGYGMPGIVVDGQDVIAVAETVMDAVERARNGEGPAFIECKCYRYGPHEVGVPDMRGYEVRPREEIAEMKKRDPVDLCRERLMKDQILVKKDILQIEQGIADELKATEVFADQSPDADPSIFPEILYAK